MSAIADLAIDILDEKEFQLSWFLSDLLENPKCYLVTALVEDILPKYSEEKEGHSYTLQPDPIYRPLYYLHTHTVVPNFGDITRHYISLAAAHIEGCLYWLTETPIKNRKPSKPFGGLVFMLNQQGIIPNKLSLDLMNFNKIVNVPSKHFTANFRNRSSVEERTFSCFDAALALIMMRKLSMQLFDILISKGICLPYGWKQFDERWLSPMWSSTEDQDLF